MTEKTRHPLRAWRIKNLMTLAELGEKLGCGVSIISEIECYKKNPSEQMLATIRVITGLRRLGHKKDHAKGAEMIRLGRQRQREMDRKGRK